VPERDPRMSDVVFRMIELAQKDYCCSQILIMLGLECQDTTNKELVRSMAGLCHGLGHSGELCGALSAGACLLAFHAGKGADEERVDERLEIMIGDLTEWFKEQVGASHGGIKCSEITGAACKPDISRCGAIVADTYAMVMQILRHQGIDPALGRKENA
jgi:hypothetical protein